MLCLSNNLLNLSKGFHPLLQSEYSLWFCLPQLHPMKQKQLTAAQNNELLALLKKRFEQHMERHQTLEWMLVQDKLKTQPNKLWSLYQMEQSGGEPDVISYHTATDRYTFYDCSAESPAGRRSLCFDREAWEARKEHRPENNAMDVANEMGVEILTELQYRHLQQLGAFDLKTSSWIQTPANIRKLGGALFCDRRYDTVFVYHNGVQSYYAARGFRAVLEV